MPRPRLPLALLLSAACSAGSDETGDIDPSSTSGAASSSTTADPQPTTGDPPDPLTGSTTTDATTGDPLTGTTAEPSTGEPALAPVVHMPRAGIDVGELALLVNDMDPQSVAVADYYRQKRQIPDANVITVSFPPADSLDAATFNGVKDLIEQAIDPNIQAYAISWTNPHRVDCQSLVSALALGVDPKYCSTQGNPCGVTAPSGYYDSPSFAPFTDHGLRPAMHLAGVTPEDVFEVIDRGVAADSTYPGGVGYFVRTTDSARSVRWPDQQATQMAWAYDGGLALQYLDNSGGMGLDYITGQTDVLFYLTGLADVPEIASNTYLPGAIADHLTSFGGQIPQSGQMSIVRWLEAGATASYGTAFEPCNFPNKFTTASVLLPHYFRGETLIEAYWKAVDWPGEGVFVGEPLARPWGGAIVTWNDPELTIATYQLVPGVAYELQSGPTADGPWTTVTTDITVTMNQRSEIVVPDATAPHYRVLVKP